MEEAEEKGNEEISKSNSDFVGKIKKNPWQVSTVALGLITIVLLILNFSGMTGKVISEDKAAESAIGLIKQAYGVSLEYVSAQEEDGLYAINCLLDGQPLVIKTTKDFSFILLPGNRWVKVADLQEKIDSTQQTQQKEVPKSNKPKIELFIWGYCPYGVQAQGPLAEVASLLGKYAEFESVLYYDGHGEYETQQNKIQGCIQEIANDKYWDYAEGFVEDIYSKCGSSRDIDCDKTESVKLMKSLGIDDSKVMSCVEEKGDDLLLEYSSRASGYGITGSPTLVINGVKVTTSRTAEAFKAAVCDAFNDAPTECSEELSSSSSASSGSC